MKKVTVLVRKFLIFLGGLIGYNIFLEVAKKNKLQNIDQINLNIGAGRYLLDGFLSLDYFSEYYYPDKKKFLKERVSYDLRNDDLPFKDNSVENIYISHVVEHIEDTHVVKFIQEAYRVLKPNGVLRIVCPDAKFLFNVSQFENGFWTWRKKTFSGKNFITDWSSLSQYDFLIREVATQKCRFYLHKKKELVSSTNEYDGLNFDTFKEKIKENLTFRPQFTGDHINLWDFDAFQKLGLAAGFSYVIESKQSGSVSAVMQNLQFDRTAPQMSLYVDMVK